MPDRMICLFAFVAYLVFACVFVYVGRTADFFKSNIDLLVKAYREAAKREDGFGKFLFGGLLVLRIGIKIGVWGFLAVGLGIVATICGANETGNNFMKPVQRMLLDFYDFVQELCRSLFTSARHSLNFKGSDSEFAVEQLSPTLPFLRPN